MLQYDKIDVSEEIIANETTGSRDTSFRYILDFTQKYTTSVMI